MPNDYFRFQQFRVEQARCAQKVGTDACVLGAAAPLPPAPGARLLDVGTGTGLLALMAAQRHPTAGVEAVEIDPAAAAQAAENFAASPWAPRLRVHALSLAEYAATAPAPFDGIVCNPPFFRRSLPPPDPARRRARHANSGAGALSFAELAGFAARFLRRPAGQLAVLLPPAEADAFAREAAAAGLHPASRLAVRPYPGAAPNRVVAAFGFEPGAAPREAELAVYEAPGGPYSAAFRALLGGFYLAL